VLDVRPFVVLPEAEERVRRFPERQVGNLVRGRTTQRHKGALQTSEGFCIGSNGQGIAPKPTERARQVGNGANLAVTNDPACRTSYRNSSGVVEALAESERGWSWVKEAGVEQ